MMKAITWNSMNDTNKNILFSLTKNVQVSHLQPSEGNLVKFDLKDWDFNVENENWQPGTNQIARNNISKCIAPCIFHKNIFWLLV